MTGNRPLVCVLSHIVGYKADKMMDECNLYLSENSYDTAFFHTGHKLGELVNWWSHTGLAAFKASLYSHFTVARKRQRAAFNTHRSLLAAKC